MDFNADGRVNFIDYCVLAGNWADDMCTWPEWCENCDSDENGAVDSNDLAAFSDNWLKEYRVKFYEFSLDSDPNWSTSGEWDFGQATGGGTLYGHPDPTTGYTGINVYGVNLDGDYSTAVGGPYYLKAGPLDCGLYHSIRLSFARWLNTDEPPYVESTIDISNSSLGPWTTVFRCTLGDTEDGGWRIVDYDISSVADGQETVYIRWGYEIFELAYPCSGWNIDDIKLSGYPQ
jgi:hypothetical protein